MGNYYAKTEEEKITTEEIGKKIDEEYSTQEIEKNEEYDENTHIGYFYFLIKAKPPNEGTCPVKVAEVFAKHNDIIEEYHRVKDVEVSEPGNSTFLYFIKYVKEKEGSKSTERHKEKRLDDVRMELKESLREAGCSGVKIILTRACLYIDLHGIC